MITSFIPFGQSDDALAIKKNGYLVIRQVKKIGVKAIAEWI